MSLRRLLVQDYREVRKTLLAIREKRFRYAVTESLATLLPAIMWKIENVPHAMGDLAKEVPRQGYRSPWLIFPADIEMGRESNSSRKKKLHMKERESAEFVNTLLLQMESNVALRMVSGEK